MEIKTPQEKDLYSFFKSLDDETLYNFSLYPNVNYEKEAKKASEELLKDKNQKIFGLFNDDRMVGYGILRFFPKETRKKVCNLGIVINKDFQSQGFGKKLANEMMSWAKTKDFKKIWLTVYADNLKAVRFYFNLGFEAEGIFMHDEYFNNQARNSISMAYFFDKNLKKEREKIWENLSKMPARH